MWSYGSRVERGKRRRQICLTSARTPLEEYSASDVEDYELTLVPLLGSEDDATEARQGAGAVEAP